jgi:hypothetical protein
MDVENKGLAGYVSMDLLPLPFSFSYPPKFIQTNNATIINKIGKVVKGSGANR